MATLEERTRGGDAPAWRPDQDDAEYIEGTVVDIARGSNEWGVYPIVTLRLEDGTEKAIHGFRTVIRNELMKVQPKIGETMGVLYQGEVKTKPGSKFKSYTGYVVKVEREGGSFDWSTLGGEQPVDDFLAGTRVVYETPEDAGTDDIPF